MRISNFFIITLILTSYLLVLPSFAEIQTDGDIWRDPTQVTIDSAQTISNKTLLGPDGSATVPTYSFLSDTDVGIFLAAPNTLGIALANARQFDFTNPGVFRIWHDNAAIYFGAANDAQIFREAAGTFQFGADSATPVNYELKAGDGSGTDINGANFTFSGGDGSATNSNGGNLILQGGTEQGSGTKGTIDIIGNLYFPNDGIYDIGASNDINRPRNIWVAMDLFVADDIEIGDEIQLGASPNDDTWFARESTGVIQFGDDTSAPVNYELKASDGLGTDINGANFTLSGGDGSLTNSNGGDLILQGGTGQGTGSNGLVSIETTLRLPDNTSKGTCTSSNVRTLVYETVSNVGSLYICRQTGASTYAWTVLH